MSTNSIPQDVLSNRFRQAIDGRRVKVAVFLTFQFDPGFFEEEILSDLFHQSFSHIPKIRLLQLEEALREVHHVAVYYDRAGLTAEAKPAKLDYQRLGLSHSNGYFHPKNIFLLLENGHEQIGSDSLVIVTLSANLTRSGWWENVEVAHIEEVKAGEKCSFRNDLLDLITRLKDADKTSLEHPGLDSIQAFLHNEVDEASPDREKGRWSPRVYSGKQSVPEFLKEFIEPGTYNLEIISPYFDDTDSAGVLSQLLQTLKPKATRLFLPEGKDGAALCQPGFFEAVERLGVAWGRLPAGPLRPASANNDRQPYRFVHAKSYRFWNRKREIFLVGSVNLTHAAHQAAPGGNFETAVLFETLSPSHLGWWLEAINETKPTEFRLESSEDTARDEVVGNFSLRYNWEHSQLDYFWEKRPGPQPRQAVITAGGVNLFTLDPIEFGRWTILENDQAAKVETLLKSTSLVEVSVDEGSPFRILIQEEGMAHKPSIFLSFSAEDILQYWSLLSPEQREAFISVRAGELALDTEMALPSPHLPAGDTMFDRFAGIFHAFGRLEQHVVEALSTNRQNEAVYRLFGKKYDSLPSLIAKVVQDQKADRVNQYVTLLCARQVLEQIEVKYPDFKQLHQAEFSQVYEQLKAVDEVRAGFTFAREAELQHFFEWFDQMFFLDLAKETAL